MTTRSHNTGLIAIVAVLVVILSFAACSFSPPQPPVSDAVYDLPKTLTYNIASKQYLVHFDGVLPYTFQDTDSSGNTTTSCKNLSFSFVDHPQQPAELQVWINDVAGLQQGEQFQYTLAFNRPDGSQAEAFTLIASNPLTGPARQYDFKFVIRRNSGDPNLLWQNPDPISGDYSIVTDRAMTVTLEFTLRQTVTGAPGPACGAPH